MSTLPDHHEVTHWRDTPGDEEFGNYFWYYQPQQRNLKKMFLLNCTISRWCSAVWDLQINQDNQQNETRRRHDRVAGSGGGGQWKKAAGNLISQNCSSLSHSAPSCLLTHDRFKMNSSRGAHTQPLLENGSQAGLTGRREMGRRWLWKKEREMVGGNWWYVSHI